MKKSLIALAVLSVSGLAMAQSSVTLYGVADVGFGGGTGEKFRMIDGAGGANSRFGLRGSEDLGGGLKANFAMENGTNLTDGVINAGAGAGKFFQRQAWLGMSGGFGEVRLGRQYTVGFDTDIWTMLNTRTNSQLRTGLGFNGAVARNDNMIRYISPDLGGIRVHGSYQLKNNNNPNTTELAVRYGNGPIAANLYVGKVKGLSTGWALNGSYDFGGVKAIAGFTDLAGKNTGRGFHLGAVATMAPATLFVNVARNTDAKLTGIDLGARYSLSKRTYLYAGYGRVNKGVGNRYGLGLDHSF